jgi:hypothetical protein
MARYSPRLVHSQVILLWAPGVIHFNNINLRFPFQTRQFSERVTQFLDVNVHNIQGYIFLFFYFLQCLSGGAWQ